MSVNGMETEAKKMLPLVIAERDRLAAELAQARADAKAAVAVAIENAVKQAETCRDVAVHDDGHAVGWRNASQAIAGGIRALAPDAAIAEVARMRAERETLRSRAETEASMFDDDEPEYDHRAGE